MCSQNLKASVLLEVKKDIKVTAVMREGRERLVLVVKCKLHRNPELKMCFLTQVDHALVLRFRELLLSLL